MQQDAKVPSTYWIRDWVGARVGLDAVEKRKTLHFRESNTSHPALSPQYRKIS
jgi:hypothetical protein